MVVDALTSSGDKVRGKMAGVSARLSMNANDYQNYVAQQESKRKEALASAYYVNTVRDKITSTSSFPAYQLYKGTFREELAAAYAELHGFNRSTNTILETANREFLNNIVGEGVNTLIIDGGTNPVSEFYNMNAAIGTFHTVCARVQVAFAQKYGCASFQELKNHPNPKAQQIYKDFTDYYEKSNGDLLKLKKRAEMIATKNAEAFEKTGMTPPELLLTALYDTTTFQLKPQGDAINTAKAGVATSTKGGPFVGAYSKLLPQVLQDMAAKRAKRRQNALKGGAILGAGAVATLGTGAILQALNNQAAQRKEADYREALQELANDYGFNNIDELRGFVNGQLGVLDTRDTAILQSSIRTNMEQAQLDKINTEMGTEYNSLEEFMAAATEHTKMMEGMTQEQYLEGIVNRRGEVLYEGLDMQHERHINEIVQEFSTKERDFFTADGNIDYNALDDFIARNTMPGLPVNEDVVDARLLQAKLNAEDLSYQAKCDEAEQMDWPQDMPIYDGKVADYINEIESIQDILSTENGLLMHLDLLTSSDASADKLQAILIDSQNRFGENWDNAVGWDQGWDETINNPEQGEGVIVPGEATPGDTTVTPEGTTQSLLDDSNQDILDAQQSHIADDIDNIQAVVESSANIAMDTLSLNMDQVGLSVPATAGADNHGIIDTISDNLNEIFTGSLVVGTAVMAARMWLIRHNVVKAKNTLEIQQQTAKEQIDLADRFNKYVDEIKAELAAKKKEQAAMGATTSSSDAVTPITPVTPVPSGATPKGTSDKTPNNQTPTPQSDEVSDGAAKSNTGEQRLREVPERGKVVRVKGATVIPQEELGGGYVNTKVKVPIGNEFGPPVRKRGKASTTEQTQSDTGIPRIGSAPEGGEVVNDDPAIYALGDKI